MTDVKDSTGTAAPPAQPRQARSAVRLAGIGILLFVIGLMLPYLISFLIADSRRTVNDAVVHYRDYWRYELIALASVGVAWLLYHFRQRHRAWYGGLEIMVAYLGAFHSSTRTLSLIVSGSLFELDTDPDRMLALLALATSVYVGVRGFDNLAIGLKELKEKRAAA
jgi:hypothetical protein